MEFKDLQTRAKLALLLTLFGYGVIIWLTSDQELQSKNEEDSYDKGPYTMSPDRYKVSGITSTVSASYSPSVSASPSPEPDDYFDYMD